MRIGICTNFLTEDRYSMHEELWEKIRSHADFIEFPAFPLMEMSDDEFILFREKLEEKGLRADVLTNIFPPYLHLMSDPFHKIARYSERLVSRSEMLGVSRLVLGSGPARRLDDGTDESRADEIISSIVLNLLVPSGCEILIEPLRASSTNYINSVKDAVRICRLCNTGKVNIVADSYNLMEGDFRTDMIQASAYITHVHISDDERRIDCGALSEELMDFLMVLKAIRYDGTLSFECALNLDSSFEELKKKICNTIDKE